MNTCTFVGNVASEPERKGAESNVLAFRLAVNSRTFNPETEQWEDSADFFPMVMFGNRAKAIGEFLAKGMDVTAIAHAKQNTWKTEDGQNRSSIEFVIDDIKVHNRKAVA